MRMLVHYFPVYHYLRAGQIRLLVHDGLTSRIRLLPDGLLLDDGRAQRVELLMLHGGRACCMRLLLHDGRAWREKILLLHGGCTS